MLRLNCRRSNKNLFHFKKNITVILYLCILSCFFSCDITLADIVTYKEGYPDPFTSITYQGTRDTTIDATSISYVGSSANQNYGGRDYLAVGRNVQFGFFGPQRTLISFNINSITNKYNLINSITFRFFPSLVFLPGSITSNTISVYELTDANNGWIEGNEFESILGGDPDVGMVTWNNKIEGFESWAGSIGVSSPGIDYWDVVLDSSTFDSSTAVETPYDFVITGQAANDLVQSWLTTPDNGIILVSGDDTYHSHTTIIRFWSSESTNINYRPELIIDFIPALEPVRIAGFTPYYYSSIQTAYDDANDGDVIQIRAVTLNENLYIDFNKSITIEGGYDKDYTMVNGITIINGSILISSGKIIIGNGQFKIL